VIHTEVPVPDSGAFYYAGVGAMAALDFIDWPVALVIAAGHLIAERSKDRAVKEIGEGVSAGG
jgi:hypothetical protein